MADFPVGTSAKLGFDTDGFGSNGWVLAEPGASGTEEVGFNIFFGTEPKLGIVSEIDCQCKPWPEGSGWPEACLCGSRAAERPFWGGSSERCQGGLEGAVLTNC